MEWFALVVPVVIGYLLGAIPAGMLVARAAGIKDIRQHGSGNIGATNVWRVCGGKVAVWVYICDIGKGMLAILIARQFDQTLIGRDMFLVICAGATVVGNLFPVFLKFRGGKGVNTALGVMLILLPVETGVAIVVFLLVVVATRLISLGSMTGAAGLLAAVLVRQYALDTPVALPYRVVAALLLLAVLYSHRKNIGRIIAGTENRFSISRKSHD
jgi:glycerol-3-phosphate acyltransferase PlsY